MGQGAEENDMSPSEAAASSLMADLHNSGLMKCAHYNVQNAANVIKAAFEAAIAAETKRCAQIASEHQGKYTDPDVACEAIHDTILNSAALNIRS